jgi:2-hydroxycyclohexanecarboxyl-coA dehydrogenase
MVSDKKIFHGMTALVTGGSSGIGLEFATQLAQRGINILIVSNQEQLLKDTATDIANRYNVKTYFLYKDLSEENAAVSISKFCEENNIKIDILINNAGIFTFKELTKHSPSQLNTYINLHIRCVTELCHIFGSQMKERKSGYILNMSSMSCWMPMPGIAMYAATKAYIRVLSRSLHLECKDYNVSVTVACPGGIATDLFGLPRKLQQLGVNLGILVKPRKFVAKALSRMFRKKPQYINGLFNRISIFFVAVLPSQVKLLVKHRLLDRNE